MACARRLAHFAFLTWTVLCHGQLVADDELLTFEKHVRPILKAYCIDCHGAGDTLHGELDLRLRRFMERGGSSGAAIIAGQPALSPLVQRIKSGEMPPLEKKVPPEKIATIERWIESGARALRDEPLQLPAGIDITPEERAHWAYQPIHRVEPPGWGPDDRVRTAIDGFLLAKLRERGLAFSPDADRVTLIRRVAFDLTGLPPTVAEIAAFEHDSSPGAYEAMVQRYLDSPSYGERWGRHWLDVAGYAESEGNGNEDVPRPYAYKYRDYVVRSLNSDKPFDRFVQEQLAGDELVPQPWSNLSEQQIEVLAATAFLRMGVDGTATGPDDALVVNQVVADAIKIVGSSLLGLTVGCAQCHDHRYDPIPQEDYFRLRAIIEPAFDASHWRRPGQRLISLYTDADRAKANAVEAEAQQLQKALDEKSAKFVAEAFAKELTKFPEDQREILRIAFDTAENMRTPDQAKLVASNPSLKINGGVLYQYNQAAADEIKKDQEQVNAKRAEKPAEDYVSVLNELPDVVPATHVHFRGDPRQPKQAVLPGDLTIAAQDGQRFELPVKDPARATTGRRLAYAQHLMNGQHPLTGRVLVNRIWLNHFGRGLVDPPGDFGALGHPPTHPELLDWLADEWYRLGWSLKKLHLLIMSSTAYRQSSTWTSQQLAVDRENALLGHFPLRRLDAESLRDRMLAVTGTLDRTMHGPSVPVEDDTVGQVVPKGESARRSLYLQVRRTKPVSFLAAFDAPVMTVNCEKREASTVAPQSLMLMNSDFVLKQSRLLAQKVRQETPPDYGKDWLGPDSSILRNSFEDWQFGYGGYDEVSRRLRSFSVLPHWTGSAWQGSASLPDPTLSWVIVHATGGHTGNSPDYASVRRWTASENGSLRVAGALNHASENGDGVRGRLVSSRNGLLGEWTVKNSNAVTEFSKILVERGDQIDFIVDCIENVTSDSYEWIVKLSLTGGNGSVVRECSSNEEFHGPIGTTLIQQAAYAWQLVHQRPIPLSDLSDVRKFLEIQVESLRRAQVKDADLETLVNYCQQLLSSNEFLYVD